jgi:hypothetical protein
MQHFKMLIGGELVDASDGARLQSIDPGSGEVVATCPSACVGRGGSGRSATGAPGTSLRAIRRRDRRGVSVGAVARAELAIENR